MYKVIRRYFDVIEDSINELAKEGWRVEQMSVDKDTVTVIMRKPDNGVEFV